MFLDNLAKQFSSDIALDLGTANIRVCVKEQEGIVIEPSLVAINTQNGKLLAVGHEARRMVGRTPANIVATQPLKNGVISDFTATEAIIHYFIQKSKDKFKFPKNLLGPRVIVGVPSLITEVEINAVIDSAKSAGARKVYVVEEPIAAAIGAGLPIEDSLANMVIDIGGGTSDIAIISLGGMIVDNTIKIAGDEMDESIVEYIKDKYNLAIGSKMAEDLKYDIGCVVPFAPEKRKEIKGRDLITGLPKSLWVSSTEIMQPLVGVCEKIANASIEALEKSPPEIVSDIITNGILLTGGGAQIYGLDKFLSARLKVNIKIAKKPVYTVVDGLRQLLDNIDLLDKVQIKHFILK